MAHVRSEQHAEAIARLGAELGQDAIETDIAVRSAYGYDNSRRHALPDAVVRPDNAEMVARAIRICHDTRTPVTARGLGTATTGAAVPIAGGIVLSTERLRHIRLIDADNRLAVVDAGVTNGELQAAAGARGFFWGPDPTSADYSTVGGNLACNAAGPRAVKYGSARDNTLGLRAVTGAGVELRTGVCTTKGVMGYDLTRLIIGSEGTLAIITEATLALTPSPQAIRTLRATYRNVDGAARAVSRIMAQPVTPRVLEFMDDAATGLVREQTGLAPGVESLLLIEVDGLSEHLDAATDAIRAAADSAALISFEVASGTAQQTALWAARRALSPSLRRLAPVKINEDVVVPVARIAELVAAVRAIGQRHDILTACFGHAGNGNIHVNLLGQETQREALRLALHELMRAVVAMQGTLSGEHGVGIDKLEFVRLEIEPEALALMRAIKAQFDPQGILNPGKVLPAI